MWIKESIKNKFSDKEIINLVRFKAVRIIFVFAVFLFFINFYLVGANYYFDFLIIFLPFTYYFLLNTLLFYILFLIKVNIKNKLTLFILIILLIIFYILLLLPFSFEWGFSSLINILF